MIFFLNFSYFSLGRMEGNIEVIGKMENKMVKGNFIRLWERFGKKGFGLMVKEFLGKIQKLFRLKDFKEFQ